jgi:hypothetical protein
MDHMVPQIARARARLALERWAVAVEGRRTPPDRRAAIEPEEGLCAGEGVREAAAELPEDAPQAARMRLSLARQAALLHAELAAREPVERIEAGMGQPLAVTGIGTTNLGRAEAAVARERRPGARLQLWHARESALHGLRSELAARAGRTGDALASLVHRDGASAAALLRGTTHEAAQQAARGLLDRTEDAWREMGGWLLRRWLDIGWHEAREHDVTCILATPALHVAFPAGAARLAASATLRDLGLWPSPVREGLLSSDGSALPLVAAVDPPHDVRVALPSLAPDGPASWSHALAALTAAVALAAIDPDAHPRARLAADVGAAAPGAALLGALVQDAAWRRRRANVALGVDEARELALSGIGALRADAATVLATLAVLRDGPTAAAREEATLSWRRALGVDPGSWRWLNRFDPGLDRLDALEIEVAAAAWSERLRELFDEQWYRVPEAGELLRRAFAGGGDTDPRSFGAVRGDAATAADPLLRALE